MAVILIVDDNSDHIAVYSAILDHSGHTVHTAADGADGVSKAREIIPDLILIDIGMPVMDGWEAHDLLKLSPATVDIPVIALTAHVLSENRARAEQAGFAGFIGKSEEPRCVLEAVERLVGKA